MNRLVPLFAILCLLTGCGFNALYSDHPGGAAEGPQSQLEKIYVGNIPDRDGQILRNNLLDRFYMQGAPEHAPYYLVVSPLQIYVTGQAISVTSDATRAELRITSRFSLSDRKSGCVLLRRDLLSVNSYNILASEYTTLVSRQAVEENELNELAQQIETQLALYFARTPDPQGTLAKAIHAPSIKPIVDKDAPVIPPRPTADRPLCPAIAPGVTDLTPEEQATQQAIDAMSPEAQGLPSQPKTKTDDAAHSLETHRSPIYKDIY